MYEETYTLDTNWIYSVFAWIEIPINHLNFNSYQPFIQLIYSYQLKHKASVIKTFVHRAKIITSDESQKVKEIKKILDTI